MSRHGVDGYGILKMLYSKNNGEKRFMKLHVRELMHRLSQLLEILVGVLMLGALFAALVGLVFRVNLSMLVEDPNAFSEYLRIASMIVIGVEFVKMLCTHTLDSVVEIMLLAIARQMITEHTTPTQNLIAVVSIAVLYLVRKFLYIPQLDKINHTNLFDFISIRKKKGSNGVLDEKIQEKGVECDVHAE